MIRNFYEQDEEQRYLSDVLLQIRQGVKTIYVYKESIVNLVKEMGYNINVKKKSFYWEIESLEQKSETKRGRPRKVVYDR